jgi:uncharacterized heparinase superfamily protein
MKLLRLIRTVAPLRPVQIYGRVLFRLARPRPDLSPAPPRRALAGWTSPVPRQPTLIGRDDIVLLNVSGSIGSPTCWNDPVRDKLWLYNLHYFDELATPADAARQGWQRRLVDRWIAENPIGVGNGWEPYPVSLRIVNWIKWALAGEALSAGQLDSLAAQVRWLVRRLEWHLLGNHLFANAKALIFAGLFFDGEEGRRWLERGLSILKREIPEQVLADGGHFELSPMYHSIIYEDVLDLVNLARAAGVAQTPPFAGWVETARRMGDWLAAMTHPDGQIAFFNDSAFDIAPEPAEIAAYAVRLGQVPAQVPRDGIARLEASGYVRLQIGRAVALLDVARVGPDYMPGHAHADTLAFELSVDGRRIVVNGGTSTYAGPARSHERSTAAHSTVEVDGVDSSETWGSFRVGRRARVVALRVEAEREVLTVTAAHDGYHYLPGRPIHRRSWRLDHRGLTIEDSVSGLARQAIARFHLAPDVAVETDGCSARLAAPGLPVIHWRSSAPMVVGRSACAQRFGVVTPSSALTAPVGEDGLRTEMTW